MNNNNDNNNNNTICGQPVEECVLLLRVRPTQSRRGDQFELTGLYRPLIDSGQQGVQGLLSLVLHLLDQQDVKLNNDLH